MGQTCSDPSSHKDVALPDLTPEAGWEQRTYLREHDVQVGNYGTRANPSGSPYQAYQSSYKPPNTSSVPGTMASTPAQLTESRLATRLANRQGHHTPEFTWQQDAYLLAHNADKVGDQTAHHRVVDWSAQTMKKWRTDPFYEWRDEPDYPPNRSIPRKDWCWQYPDVSDQTYALPFKSRTPEDMTHDHHVTHNDHDSASNRGQEHHDSASNPVPMSSFASNRSTKHEVQKPWEAMEVIFKAEGLQNTASDHRRVGPYGLPVPVNRAGISSSSTIHSSADQSHAGHRERLLPGPPGCFQRR